MSAARVKRDCQCKRASHVHGTRTAYVVDKCRCRPCTDALRIDRTQKPRPGDAPVLAKKVAV